MNETSPALLYFVVPEAIDDAARISGGNVYDQRIRDDLRGRGRAVRMLMIADRQKRRLADALTHLPDGALVLIDGLVAAGEPGAVADNAGRLRLVILAHMAYDSGGSALRAAERVIATSYWTRAELIERDLAEPRAIVVAQPGTDPAPATEASETGGRLLCVAAVAPHKGQDLLIRALAGLPDDEAWTCTIVGSLAVAPEFVAEVTSAVDAAGLSSRVTFTGALSRPALESEYERADLVIVPSRNESYGMVVTESFARGIPVVATAAGGLPEAVAECGAGIIVPPDDAWALGVVLRQWLASPPRRRALKEEAVKSRSGLRSWNSTGAIISSTLDGVAASPIGQPGVSA